MRAMSSDEWLVFDCGPVVRVNENLRHVDGSLPKMPLRRRMTVARTSNGKLVFHSPIALGEDAMKDLEGWGEPAFIIAPNAWHRLDSPRFKKRYPNAKLLCPEGARKKVQQVVTVDGTYDDFPEDDVVKLHYLEGVRRAEGVMEVRSNEGTTLVFNDALFNIPHGKGLTWLIMRLLGSTGGPKVTRVMRWFAVKDKKALSRCLQELAATENLVRLIPGHGAPIEENAASILRDVAGAL
jgi:hypothetical protein